MLSPNAYFTVSRVCELTGIPAGELEWLEHELGDLLEIRRTHSGSRLFTRDAIERLRQVQRLLHEEEMDLDQVKSSLGGGAMSASDTLPRIPDWDQADAAAIAAAAALAADVENSADDEINGGDATASEAAITQRLSTDDVVVPPLPLNATVDLLLEAAEGLVQENLKLRCAVDTMAERCQRLEDRLDEADSAARKGRWRLFGRT